MDFHGWTEGIPCRVSRDVTESIPYYIGWCIDVGRSRGGKDDIFTGDDTGCETIAWWPHFNQDEAGGRGGSVI